MRTQNINRIWGDTIQTVNLSKSVSIQQTAHLNQPTNKSTPYSNNVCNSKIQKQQVYIKRTSKTSLLSKTACWRRNSNKLEGITACSCKPCGRCITGKIGWSSALLSLTMPGYYGYEKVQKWNQSICNKIHYWHKKGWYLELPHITENHNDQCHRISS